MYLEQLIKLVPPPAKPVNTGSTEEWEMVLKEVGVALPIELYELNTRYGSGFFLDGEFGLELHSVFRPGYSLLVEWNRRIFDQEEKESPEHYKGMFEIGGYSMGDDFNAMGRLFWTVDPNSIPWKIGVSCPLTWYCGTLTDFLIGIFSNTVRIPGFPASFRNLRFEPWERAEPGR